MEIRNLLLVENDRTVLRAIARVLRHEGYVTWSVASAAAALALDRDFDCGVFDIDLDDGDGIKLARQMLDEGRVRCAIFFTGCHEAPRLAAARALGDLVIKGSSSRVLLDALQACIRKHFDAERDEEFDTWSRIEIERI